MEVSYVPSHNTLPVLDKTDATATESLIAYFRQRVATFEEERKEYLQRLEKVEVSHAELHRTKWDLKVRQEEIQELQNALSDANVHLFKEREQVLKLMAENEQLKAQEIEDRRKIQHLLALSDPVAQDVTFYRDCRPNKTRPTDPSQTMDAMQLKKMGKKGVSSKDKRIDGDGSGKVLRTIYLPTDCSSSLAQQVESLKRQLRDSTAAAKANIHALEQDRAERELARRTETGELRKAAEALEKEKRCLSETLQRTTKDYLELRRQLQQTEAGFAESHRKIIEENKDQQEELQLLKQKASMEVDMVKSSLRKDNRMYMEQLRKTSVEREKMLVQLRSEKEMCAQRAERVQSSLKDKVAALKKKYSLLDARRNMDLEGFSRDLSEIREKVRTMEAYVLGHSSAAATRKVAELGSGSQRTEDLKGEVKELRSMLSNLATELEPKGKDKTRAKRRPPRSG